MEFQLIYDGRALDNHEINPLDLSIALIAINNLLETADNILNKGKTKTEIKVKASFETGSFKINFKNIQSILDKATNLFNSNEVNAILNAVEILGFIYGLYKLLSFLKGNKPTKIYENEDGTFTVIQDKTELNVEKHTLELYKNFKIRKAFEKLVEPLNTDGIENLAIKQKNKIDDDFIQITKEEQEYFKCPKPQEELIDEKPQRFETNISIINLSFKESNKWYVNDGEASFYVNIEDNEFINKIDNNIIKFSKGDILRVQIRRVQYYNLDENKLKSEHFIEKVIYHKTPEQTIDLFNK